MELAGLLVRNLTAGNASCVLWAIGETACHRLVLKGAGNDWTGATHTQKRHVGLISAEISLLAQPQAL